MTMRRRKELQEVPKPLVAEKVYEDQESLHT